MIYKYICSIVSQVPGGVGAQCVDCYLAYGICFRLSGGYRVCGHEYGLGQSRRPGGPQMNHGMVHAFQNVHYTSQKVLHGSAALFCQAIKLMPRTQIRKLTKVLV